MRHPFPQYFLNSHTDALPPRLTPRLDLHHIQLKLHSVLSAVKITTDHPPAPPRPPRGPERVPPWAGEWTELAEGFGELLWRFAFVHSALDRGMTLGFVSMASHQYPGRPSLMSALAGMRVSTPPPTLPSHPHPRSQQQQQQQQPYSPSPSRSQPHKHPIPSPQQQQPHAPQPRRAALFSPFAPMSASGSSSSTERMQLPRQTQTPPRPASASVFSTTPNPHAPNTNTSTNPNSNLISSSSTSTHTTPSRSEQLLRDALRRGSVGSAARPQGLNSPLSRSASTSTKGHGRGGQGHGRSWSVQIQGVGGLTASPSEGGRQLKRQRHEDVVDGGGGRGGVYGGDAEFSPSASGSRGYHSTSNSPAQVRLQQQRAGALAVLEGGQREDRERERDPEHEALKARLERVLASGDRTTSRERTSASGFTGTRSSLPGSDYSASSASSGGQAGRRMSFAANTSPSTSAGVVKPSSVSTNPNSNPNAHAERTMTTTPRPYTPTPKTPMPPRTPTQGSPNLQRGNGTQERTPTKRGMGRRGELEVGVGVGVEVRCL
ncbi:hypothetical protein R3P38DRAFT_3221376 [Favolaschia claudopus]|uniref:Uncharacterized protein n=1 Tax=Favolaschia claudopus TaxID=2862362 RepID=A0AAW0A1Q1_9AGAR